MPRDDDVKKNLSGDVTPDADQQDAILETEMFPEGGKPSKKGNKGRPAKVRRPSPQQWLSQIQQCEKHVEQSQNRARANLNRFKNRHSSSAIALLTPLIEIKSALSTFRNPYISVRPRKKVSPTTPEETLAAAIKEVYINWLWGELDLKHQVRQVVKDSLLLTGRGITMPGYNAVFTPDGMVEYESVIADRVSPFAYLLDVEAESSKQSYYGVRCITMPIPIAETQFKKQGVFKPIVFSRAHTSKQAQEIGRKNALKQYGRTVIYEIQDLYYNEFLYCTPGHNGWLDKFPNPFTGVEGLLPEFLEPIPIPDDTECIAEATLIGMQLDELSKIRGYWMQHWKKLLPKYLAPMNSMPQDELEKLIQGEEAAVAFIKGNPSDVKLLEVPTGQASIDIHEQHLKEDIRDITGFNEYLRGSAVPRVKTAYETNEIVSGSNIRIADLNDHVERHCSNLARKMLKIATSFITPEDLQLIVGLPVDLRQVGMPPQFALTPEIMKMDTSVTVHTGSMQVPNKETDMRRAMLLQSFMAYPEANRFAILEKIAKLVDENPSEILKQPNEVDPEMQEQSREEAAGGRKGGGGRAEAGRRTGTQYGSRPRTDLMIPGGTR